MQFSLFVSFEYSFYFIFLGFTSSFISLLLLFIFISLISRLSRSGCPRVASVVFYRISSLLYCNYLLFCIFFISIPSVYAIFSLVNSIVFFCAYRRFIIISSRISTHVRFCFYYYVMVGIQFSTYFNFCVLDFPSYYKVVDITFLLSV